MADASQNKVEYSLCEFFCADPSTPGVKFNGPCQIGTKRFSAGGAMVVDVGGLALIETASAGGGIELDRPLEFAHEGTVVKAVVAPDPQPVPTLEAGKPCGFQETEYQTYATPVARAIEILVNAHVERDGHHHIVRNRHASRRVTPKAANANGLTA